MFRSLDFPAFAFATVSKVELVQIFRVRAMSSEEVNQALGWVVHDINILPLVEVVHSSCHLLMTVSFTARLVVAETSSTVFGSLF